MQISFKTVAAAVALALGTMPALAVESTTTGNSSLFITVFDPVLGASVVQDLGINYADFVRSAVTPEGGYVANFTVDMSVFAQVGSAAGDIQYSIFAGDAVGNSTSTEAIGTAALNAGSIAGINSYVTGMLGSSGAAAVFAQWNNTCGTTAATCTGTGFGSTYFGGFADDFGGNLTVSASTNVGSALGFYSFRRSSPGAGDPLIATQYANSANFAQWLLNADGSLRYSLAPAPVPLPAALWLLLSGLTGLGVVSRRKAA